MVAVLTSSLLADRATGTSAAGVEVTPRAANGNARVAADIGFARPARNADDPVTVGTLFDAQRLASDGAVSPAAPGLDPFAIIDAARLAARAAESRQGIANAARAAGLFSGALDGIAKIETLLARMERIAADASLTDLDSTDGHTPPASLSAQDRARLNAEFAALRGEIDGLVADTAVDGVAVLGGFSFAVAVGGGGQDGDSLTVGLDSMRPADLAAGFEADDVSTLANATVALAGVQTALDTLGDIEAQARGARNRLAYAAGSLDAAAGVADAARARALVPDTGLDAGRAVAEAVLAQRGITDPPAGLGIDLTLLNGFTGAALPAAGEPEPIFGDADGTAPAAIAVPRPAAAPAAYTPEPAGPTVSISV